MSARSHRLLPELRRVQRARVKRALCAIALFLCALLGGARNARAHSVGISRADYRIDGAQIVAAVSFARSEIGLALPELDQSSTTVGALSEPARVTLAKWARAGLRFTSERGACAAQLGKADFTENDGLMFWLSYECPEPPRELELHADLLGTLSSGHRHLAHVSFPGGAADYVVERGTSPLRIGLPGTTQNGPSPAAQPGARSRFFMFFVMGLEHILTGYDHLAFLVGLLLVLGPVRSLVWAITAFTLAHSLTLSVATLGVATPSPSLIEPLIARSIVYVGVENWFVRDAVGRWRITFCFGLIHGFGFAGALRQVSLPHTELPLALFSFNLGVEAGQLAIVLLVLPALLLARQRGWLSAKRPQWLSLGVSALGCFWLVSRLSPLA